MHETAAVTHLIHGVFGAAGALLAAVRRGLGLPELVHRALHLPSAGGEGVRQPAALALGGGQLSLGSRQDNSTVACWFPSRAHRKRDPEHAL